MPKVLDANGREYECTGFLPGHWNGWALPLFTRAQAQAILEDWAKADDVAWSFDAQGALNVKFAGANAEEPCTPDAQGLYALGCYAWCWSRVKEE